VWNWWKKVPQMKIVVEDGSIHAICSACQYTFERDPNLGTGTLQDGHFEKLFREHVVRVHSPKRA